MMGRTARTLAIAGICVGLVVAGAAAEGVLHPRALPRFDVRSSAPGGVSLTQAQMDALLSKVAKSLDPQLRGRLGEAVLGESSRGGLDPLFVLALVAVESRFRVSVSSDRGAYGLMQLKPSTFAWIAGREPDLGGDGSAVSEDPVLDVRLAVRYFRWLEHRFHSRNDALMAYNAGPKRLQQYKKSGEIPDSLREYPRRVMREYQRFVHIVGGEGDDASMFASAN